MAQVNPLCFSSKFVDKESGLVYYGYRYFSPALGRWISPDPIEHAGGINLFTFVANGPTLGIDPDGHFLLLDLLGSSLIRSTLRGMVWGAGISGTISTTAKLFGAQKEWTDVGIDILKGAFSGAVGGAAGGIMKGVAGAVLPTGPNNSINNAAAAVIGGFSGGIGFCTRVGLSDRDFSETMKSQGGLMGLGLSLAIGGYLGYAGNEAQEIGGGVALDASLAIASKWGVGAAETLMDFTDSFSRWLNSQDNRTPAP
jgi:RHS repeat-associated protein